MNSTLIRAAMGSLLLGGFLPSFAQEFVQDLGSSTIEAETPAQSLLEGLREEEDLQGEALERNISTTIAETIRNEPDVAIRSMGPAAARPVIKGLSGSHVEVTEDGSFSGDMSATSPDHAVASEVLTTHKLRVLRGPKILLYSYSAAGGVVQLERNDIPFEAAGVNAAATGTATSGEYPADAASTGEFPAGTAPSGTYPADTDPAGTYPTGTNPAGTYPTGTNPAGEYPAGEYSSSTNPADTYSAGTYPADAASTGEFPAETNPAGTYPSGEFPAGTDPAGTYSTGTNLAGENPAGENSSNNNPAGTYSAGTNPAGKISAPAIPAHGYVKWYGESGQPGFATAVGFTANVKGVALKGELSGRRMADMETPDGPLENTEIKNRSGAVGAAYALGRFRLGASYRWFNSDYGIPGGFIGGHPNGVDIELWKRDLTIRGLYIPAQASRNPPDARNSQEKFDQQASRDTLFATLRVNRYHHKEFESNDYVGAEFAVNQENLRVEKNMANLGPLFGLRAGLELDSRSVKMGGYVFTPPTQSYSASLFATASAEGWKGLEMTFSSRIGGAMFRPRESVVADKKSIEDRNFFLWALSAEFSQRVAPGKFLTLDAFRTTRAPTIEELYNQGPHLAAYTYEKGYHGLDAESGYGAELEFRSYGEHLNIRAAAHGTWFLNHLAPRATGDTNWSQLLPIYQVRGDEALLFGGSASVQTVTEQGLRAGAAASYVRGIFRNGDWGDMPQIPPFKFHGELGYIWEHVRTSAHVDFALRQNFVDRYEEPTPGYVTFGLMAEFRWNLSLARYSLVLHADNLLDADVRNHLSRLKSVMPEKGRNFGALFKAEF